MNGTAWWDNAAILAVAVVCGGLILRRVIAAFSKNPGAACGSCSKCGPGEGTLGRYQAPGAHPEPHA